MWKITRCGSFATYILMAARFKGLHYQVLSLAAGISWARSRANLCTNSWVDAAMSDYEPTRTVGTVGHATPKAFMRKPKTSWREAIPRLSLIPLVLPGAWLIVPISPLRLRSLRLCAMPLALMSISWLKGIIVSVFIHPSYLLKRWPNFILRGLRHVSVPIAFPRS